MLAPFSGKIESLAVVYAHFGQEKDNGNRIYSIAAGILAPGKEPRQFSTHIHYGRFDARDRYRSGLSREKVNHAMPAEAARAALSGFLQNAPFMLTFVSRRHHLEMGAFCGIERCVDLSFAAEFFLPHFDAYTPKHLWEVLSGKERRQISFSASEMVELGIALLKQICGECLADKHSRSAPVLRFYLEKSRTLFGDVFLYAARHFRTYFGGLFDACTLPDTGNWQAFLPVAEFQQQQEKESSTCRAVAVETVVERFKTLAKAHGGFQFRPSQTEFAAAVATAFNQSQILCLEAGTGTGKTQGYLIPSLEFLRENPHARIVISTYTKSLQQQIFQREIAFSRKKFRIYDDIGFALLKGKSSYLCAEKLDYTFEEGCQGTRLLVWLYLLNTVLHYPVADADSIGAHIRAWLDEKGQLTHIQGLVSARTGCTLKHRRCPAQVAAAEAQAARLVITNHHKLALMDQDTVLAGLFQYCLIDEANHFEAAVRGAHKTEADSSQALRAAGYLERSLHRIQPRAAGQMESAIKSALEALWRMRTCMAELREVLLNVLPGVRPMEVVTLPARHPRYREQQFKAHVQAIAAAAGSVKHGIGELLGEDSCRMLKIVYRTAGKIRSELRLLADYAESLSAIGQSAELENSVLTCRMLKKHFVLGAAPVEVGEIIRQNIYRHRQSVVYTAATLRYRNSFAVFCEIAGLDSEFGGGADQPDPRPVVCRSIPSPFSSRSMRVVVPAEAVSGKYANKEPWLQWVVEILPGLIHKNRGRTLVLFASYSDLGYVAQKVEGQIVTDGYPLLVQRPGMPTVGLCEEFRSIKESVLLGVDTFWYGVDFKGDTLTQVIITRIPYPSPRDPVQQARRSLVGSRRYWRRYNYDKQIKLKQGMGRLIRSDHDRGQVVILDARYRAK